jgi:glucose/arabinose dehydrogenase
MTRTASILFASALIAAPLPSPLSPADALRAFEVVPGLRVELVAAEPLVSSPCAIAFDAKGRLFVAENRGYPIGPKEGEKPAGVIAMLEDTDGDGRMDKRTVYADGLTFPKGCCPGAAGSSSPARRMSCS